tara:strand:- start:1512 stop:1973 length:462 start_codon:yes stop_codon:yes gene_type:complete
VLDENKKGEKMDCPKCKIAKLEEKTFGGMGEKTIKVDICFSCNGIWFDKSELEQTLNLEGKPVQIKKYVEKLVAEEIHENLKCPRCQGNLAEKPSKQDKRIKIDACNECEGVWLDCGKLENLQDGGKLERLVKKVTKDMHTFLYGKSSRFGKD